ncbi:hypothetical protein L0337_15200 [candidate division KSB1 bacterium]|nr:hypothetical protein [candidate division KSB1 bacterium]
MTAQDVILRLILGGMLGVTGQGIRVIVGLKKLHHQANQEAKTFSDLFAPPLLLVSIFIGFIAGSLAIVGMSESGAALAITKETIITLLASGYAGTDFIEGFIKKYLPESESAAKPVESNVADEQPVMG